MPEDPKGHPGRTDPAICNAVDFYRSQPLVSRDPNFVGICCQEEKGDGCKAVHMLLERLAH